MFFCGVQIWLNTVVTNVKTDAPFYLRGYLAIEEEIKQITTRNDKNAFTTDLFKLEQQKRTLEQDETIQRAIDLFNETNCDSVTSYRRVDFFHPNRIKKIRNNHVED